METLIVQPKNKEQLTALKAIMKALKVDFKTEKKMDETERILANPAMVKRLDESIKQIQEGKGTKLSLDDDIWK
jgi:spore coat polysaccharide biosynthesis predicted glycosyltransferase SpsG